MDQKTGSSEPKAPHPQERRSSRQPRQSPPKNPSKQHIQPESAVSVADLPPNPTVLALENQITSTVVHKPALPELDLGVVGRVHDVLEKASQDEAAIETPLIEASQQMFNQIHDFPAYVCIVSFPSHHFHNLCYLLTFSLIL